MRNITIVEGDSFEPFYRGFGYVEFTRKVLLRCKDKKAHGLTGTITLIDAEPSKRIYLVNEAGDDFTIRYFIRHECKFYWEGRYTLYKHCPVKQGGIELSDGWARAKYRWEEETD